MSKVDLSNDPIANAVKILLADSSSWGMKSDAAKLIIKKDYRFSSKELAQLKKPVVSGETTAHILAQLGYCFSFNELMRIGNQRNDSSRLTVAHWMTKNGYFFTVDQILALGDLPDRMGNTLSSYMARHGYQFTFEEIIRLGNPADNFGTTLAHLSIHKDAQVGYVGYSEIMVAGGSEDFRDYPSSRLQPQPQHGFQNPSFTIAQLLKLRNPVDNDGDSVAHMMAKTGQVFTADELLQLGNPENKYGETIAYIMARKGYEFSSYERSQFKIPSEVNGDKDYLEIKNDEMVGGSGDYTEIKFFFYLNGRITFYYEDGGGSYRMFEVCNQEAFSIFLEYLKDTYHHDCDLNFIERSTRKLFEEKRHN